MELPSPWEMNRASFLPREEAAEEVALAMLRFDAYVSNQQGACDVPSMEAMLDRAQQLYDEASEG